MRLVWLCGIAAFLLLVGVAWYLAPLDPNFLALQFAFTPRAFAAVVHRWSPDELARYRAHLPADFVLLGCYGSFGYLLVSRSALFAQYRPGARLAARWTLPLAAAFDATENVLHWWLTEVPRFGIASPYFLAATSASLKWLLLVGFAVAVLRALERAER